ncbi:Zinc finger CCCH domain-containing protein 19 [Platanthera zijinensis]|uniref:Zinc finger CCCH domain-containing protein 19 n=1 Tax=Platanthera zijinensis TaxID=2320716 RepID=A0AAP0GAA7_9ASPA
MESSGVRSDPHPLTGKEEAIKRNTDCVYFLASPLTCKKGSECEYRHSEGARVNPRDCKFWFSGNCLNPKCLFRHPPLDGLAGNHVATPGPTMAASQAATSTHLPNSSAYNLNRNSVPCYYFQMGACLKGDKCPFMHFPQPVANPVARQSVKASPPVSAQLEAPKKEALRIKEYIINQQNSAPIPSVKGPPPPSSSKVNMSLENSINHSTHKNIGLPLPATNGLPLSQSTGVLFSACAGAGFSQPRHVQPEKLHANDMEAGEIFEEPSGTFYTGQKKRHPIDKWVEVEEVFRESSPGFDVLVDDVVDDADYLHEKDGLRSKLIQGGSHSNHDSGSRSDRDRWHRAGEGDRHRISSVSERISDKPVLPVRRSAAHTHGSPDGMEETDLRHRLMKQRRLNGSLSATVSDCEPDPYGRREPRMRERYSRNNSSGDRRLKNSIGSRLRGRITLPKAASPEFPPDFHEGGRGRQRNRVSPARPSGLQGRLGERLTRKQSNEDSPINFAGPRSLAELKGCSNNNRSISSPEHNGTSIGNTAGAGDSEFRVSFDGPKPLSALRKRSRETEPDDDAISGDGKPLGEIEVGSEDTKAVVEEDGVHNSSEIDQIALEVRDDFADQGELGCDYETADGGDYKTEDDDENTDLMNIDLDDEEDEDDFAKKIGLIFS